MCLFVVDILLLGTHEDRSPVSSEGQDMALLKLLLVILLNTECSTVCSACIASSATTFSNLRLARLVIVNLAMIYDWQTNGACQIRTAIPIFK